MDKEITITIKKEDLQALYRAYLIEYYGSLQVLSVELQTIMQKQKESIDKAVNKALTQTEMNECNDCING